MKKQLWMGGALLLLATSSALHAQNRGVSQRFDVTFEGRDAGATDADRVLFQTEWEWKMGRREKLSVKLPFQKISTSGFAGGAADASGLKDITANYDFQVRDRGEGLSTNWQVRANLPVGKDGLNAEETRAVQNLSASANSFLAPQFSLGFGLGLRHYWKRQQGNSELTGYVGYQAFGSYDVTDSATTRVENSGIDTFNLGIAKTFKNGKSRSRIGLDAIIFRDYDTTTTTKVTGASVVTEVDSDPNYILNLDHVREMTPRMDLNLHLTYQMRDNQDSFSPGVLAAAPVGVELGDRLFWHVLADLKGNDDSKWSFGFAGVNTDHSSNAAGNIAGTDGDEFYLRVGYDRALDNNGGWKVTSDWGLSSDARDYGVVVSYYRSF